MYKYLIDQNGIIISTQKDDYDFSDWDDVISGRCIVTATPDFNLSANQKIKELYNEDIIIQIEKLELKRIRAIAEPGFMYYPHTDTDPNHEKNPGYPDGLTWFDCRTQQIVGLRNQLMI